MYHLLDIYLDSGYICIHVHVCDDNNQRNKGYQFEIGEHDRRGREDKWEDLDGGNKGKMI